MTLLEKICLINYMFILNPISSSHTLPDIPFIKKPKEGIKN